MKKNIILYAITAAMALLFCWGISCLDSDNSVLHIPILAMAISGAWLVVFGIANGWFLKVGGR